MERVGVYLRLSNDDGRAGEANSIAGQRRDCRAYAERHGWAVTEYVDEGISASKGLDRPGYRRMLAAMVAGELDHIVAAKQDRFTRDRDVEFGELKRLAQTAHVEVHTADSGPLRLDTPDGALSTGIRAEFASFESQITGDRTRRGLQTRREQGEWTSSGRTYGYLKGGVVNDEQAKHVRWAYDQILNHGKSVRDVFEIWRTEGVLTVNGVPWTSVSRVHAMLLNPAIAGLVVYKGETIGTGKWEAIVTPDEQERLRAAISANARSARGYGQRTPRRRPLAGLVLCGGPTCDLLPMTSQNPGNGRGYFYWHCDRRRGGCGNRVRGDDLDLPVYMATAHFLMQTETPADATPEFDDGPMREIDEQIAEIRAALVARDMRASDAIPVLRELNAQLAGQRAARDAFEQTRRAAEDRDRVLLASLAEHVEPPDDDDDDDRELADFLPVARQVTRALGDSGDPAVIRTLIDNVRVLPEHAGYMFEGRNGATFTVERFPDGSLRGQQQ